MTKILFFIDELTGGGAEKVLQNLVNSIDQNKFQITVHTINAADPEGLLVPGIRYRAINRCKTRLGKKIFSYWIRLCAELRWLYPLYIKDDYDIEVAYLECGPTKIIAGSTNKKAKKIAWVHCDMQKRSEFVNQTEKLKHFYQAFDKVVCVSATAKDSYTSLFGNDPESIVLYNVNDDALIRHAAKAFTPGKPHHPVLAAIGRLSHEKGNDRLLEACALLKNNGYDFRLWLIGDGPEQQSLQRISKELGLDDQVQFLGFQRNPYPYIANADLIVVPSRSEGLSTVVTESLVLGKPVVTTPCSGMQELLGDSQYGFITEDSVQGIYEGIKKMLDDPALMAHYAAAAKQRGLQFSGNAILKQTEDFFLS
jgi:glycosyltransferase involved in cell wall biosynthesis